jgi:arylsulfatase B
MIRSLLLFLFTLATPALVPLRAVESAKPNIVLIVADDLGYGDLGCYGGKDIPTPHIDSLASHGIRFTSGYVTASFCAPSRAALLAGRYQTRFGFESNPTGARLNDPAVGLPARERTVADALREAGYVTTLVGKWHQGGTANYHPQRRGFDEFFGFLHEGHYYVPPPWDEHVTWLRRKALPDGGQGRWTSPDGRVLWTTHMGEFEPNYDADNPILRNSQPVEERENLTDAFAREAESFITRNKAQPFFLYLAYSAVHSPMQSAEAWLKKFDHIPDVHRRIYAAMLGQLDESVGRVLARLRAERLEERTLVVFLSDNGGPTRETTASNLPLRGGKGDLLEGGVRVPFLMRWTGRLPTGRVEPRMVSTLDLFPTFLAAAGAPIPAKLDGADLLPHLAAPGDAPLRARHYWRMGLQAAFREGDWKIHRGRSDKTWQLYHLAEDASEARDLASVHPERLAALAAAWQALDAEMIEDLWTRPAGKAR